MQFRTGGVGAFCAVLALSAHARADQFIVTDVTYTHSAQTTEDSHYRVSPSAATPKDWTKSPDWTKGSVHVLLEVKTKPSETPTKFQICFEGTPNYACTYQSDAYTKPDTYEWTTPFKNFYSDPMKPAMNWANGVSKVALILKDANNGKPQGNPAYVPSDLRVEVAVVSEGSTYKPPSAQLKDAAVEDGGTKNDASSAGPVDAGTDDEPGDGGRPSNVDSAVPPVRRDASASSSADAAARADDPKPARDGGSANSGGNESGCAVGDAGWQSSWMALLALAVVRRRSVAIRMRS